jgi:hypothetical protein
MPRRSTYLGPAKPASPVRPAMPIQPVKPVRRVSLPEEIAAREVMVIDT